MMPSIDIDPYCDWIWERLVKNACGPNFSPSTDKGYNFIANSVLMKHSKGWGWEEWLHNGDGYCLKRLCFHAQGKGSLHFHKLKCETWYVEKGVFKATTVDIQTGLRQSHTLDIGSTLTLRPCVPHQLECISVEGGVIVEASTVHDEADVYRVEPGDSQK